MYQLISYKQRLKTDEYSDEYEESLNFDKLDSQFQFVISDLIIIAIKRFQHVPINELSFKSLFTCTCIRELWKLLQLSTDYLHSVGHTMVRKSIYIIHIIFKYSYEYFVSVILELRESNL